MTSSVSRIPTFIVTGFLGSGKTTLLRRVLHDPAFANSAVIVNEFGAVGLDHELMAHAAERTIVMPGGCICCSIREDIEVTLKGLLDRVDSGSLPRFDRLVIETTGLADPAPLLFTLHASPLAAQRLEIHSVIATVDALLGADTLARHLESERQVAAADHIIISKCDLASVSAVRAMAAELRRRNPWAEIQSCNLHAEQPRRLFSHDRHRPTGNPVIDSGWALGVHGNRSQGDLQAAAHAQHSHGGENTGGDDERRGTRHQQGVGSFCVAYDHPTDWTGFGIWLTLALHRYGSQILRIKGLLAVDGLLGPVVIHGVQHVVHPPVHLERWPSDDRRSRIVLIVKDLDVDLLERSIRAFTRCAPRNGSTVSGYRLAGAGGTVGGRPIRRATAPRWLKG